MIEANSVFQLPPHDHVFLGEDHEKSERRTWAVIVLCSVMMIAEIIGGALFGSLALIAEIRQRSQFHIRHRKVRRSGGVF